MTAAQLLDNQHKSEILAFVYSQLGKIQAQYGQSAYLDDGAEINFHYMESHNPYPKQYENRNDIPHKLARKELKEAGFRIRAKQIPGSGFILWKIKKAV